MMIDRPIPTPGYNIRLRIRFTADRNDRPLAHYWSPRATRWIRLGYDVAKAFVAMDQADETK